MSAKDEIVTETKPIEMFNIEGTKPKARPSWDAYFMEMVDVVSKRATCLRRSVGAVIVKDKHILATGYNGAPKGVEDCLEIGVCLRQEMKIPSGEKHEMCRGSHAEQNAIAQAAYHGIKLKGATLYCTFLPCIICAKILINSGIDRIVFREFYPDDLSVQLLNESKIKLDLFEPPKV